MTLLTHYHDRSFDTVRQNRKAEHPAAARETAMRVFFRAAVTITLGTAAIAAIITIKTLCYLPHINY
jgi:hypothetical protein